MTFDKPPARRSRSAARRAGVLAAALTALSLAGGWLPAAAAPPDGWPVADDPSALHMLLIIAGIPLAVCAIITLLVYLPSMIHPTPVAPELAWQERSEWFGGPRSGAEAAVDGAEAADTATVTGGGSARW